MVIVVGGEHSGVGKTSLICDLIERLDGVCAIKCSVSGRYSGAKISVSKKGMQERGKDTGRFSDAGAERVIMVQAQRGELGKIAPTLERMVEGYRYVIVEGNSIIRHIRPDIVIYLYDGKSKQRTEGSIITERIADIKLHALDYDIGAVVDSIGQCEKNIT